MIVILTWRMNLSVKRRVKVTTQRRQQSKERKTPQTERDAKHVNTNFLIEHKLNPNTCTISLSSARTKKHLLNTVKTPNKYISGNRFALEGMTQQVWVMTALSC